MNTEQKIEAVYFKQVSFNDDFDLVADVGGKEILYLKLVRNIVEISDEQELTSKELGEKPSEKGLKVIAGRSAGLESMADFANWLGAGFEQGEDNFWSCFSEDYCYTYNLMLDERYPTNFLVEKFIHHSNK